MKIISISGETLSKPIPPYLSIVWHNSLEGVYCYSASLFFAHEDAHCNGGLAEVKVSVNTINVNPPMTYTTSERLFLPCRRVGGSMCLPLIAPTLIDSLVLNQWTKTKQGKKNKLKAYASKIEWVLNDKSYSFSFDAQKSETPGMQCEPITLNLKEGEKEEVIICLTRREEYDLFSLPQN